MKRSHSLQRGLSAVASGSFDGALVTGAATDRTPAGLATVFTLQATMPNQLQIKQTKKKHFSFQNLKKKTENTL